MPVPAPALDAMAHDDVAEPPVYLETDGSAQATALGYCSQASTLSRLSATQS
jgi:hypothetical protein